MNICLLNDSFPPVVDGVVNVVLNYASHLREDHGASVAVGTPRYPGADYGQYPYPVVPYPSLDTGAAASGYRAGNPFAGKAVAALSAMGPEILHAHSPASALLLARLVREETDAPLVFTYHTKYDIDIQRVVKSKLAVREAVEAMVANIAAADEVWTVSHGAGESLKALGFQGDYRVMQNGVDFDRGAVAPAEVARATADYDLPEGVPVYLFVGRMMTYKGLPLILDALGMLKRRGRDFRMLFVGAGPDREAMEQKAQSLGIGKACIFTGPVYDRDTLRALNTRADLFLFPSTFDTNGLVVREAAACGLASVLIEGSCAAEGITDGQNGFTIPESAEALAALLERVGGDLDRLHALGRRAMEELYLSWKDCVGAAYGRYQEILEEKRRGTLPQRRRLPADHFLRFTAHGMEEQEKRRQLRQELFHNFRATAAGMMDNIGDAAQDLKNLRPKT